MTDAIPFTACGCRVPAVRRIRNGSSVARWVLPPSVGQKTVDTGSAYLSFLGRHHEEAFLHEATARIGNLN
jgi:hypothetical protein